MSITGQECLRHPNVLLSHLTYAGGLTLLAMELVTLDLLLGSVKLLQPVFLLVLMVMSVYLLLLKLVLLLEFLDYGQQRM